MQIILLRISIISRLLQRFFYCCDFFCEDCESLILVIFTIFGLSRVNTDLFVILLKGGQIFTGFWEFTLLHTLSNIPMDEGRLGVHEIELVVKTSPGFGDRCGVRQHANSTRNLSKVTPWNHSGWLVVDTDLETSRTPVNKLD